MWRRAYSIDGVHQPARDFGSELHRIDTQFRARLRLWVGVMLVLYLLSGTPGANRFGEPPAAG